MVGDVTTGVIVVTVVEATAEADSKLDITSVGDTATSQVAVST